MELVRRISDWLCIIAATGAIVSFASAAGQAMVGFPH